MKTNVVLTLAACAACLSGFATDGQMTFSSTWETAKWSEKASWRSGQIAGDGGIAILPSALKSLNQDVDNLTLSQFRLETLNPSYPLTISGKSVKLTGNAEIFLNSGGTLNLRVPFVAAEATATVRKTGPRNLDPLWAPFTGFQSVIIDGGLVKATNTTGAVVADGKIALAGGTLAWAPTGSASANGTIAALDVSGVATLSVAKGSNADATLTVGALSLADEQTPLVVRTSAANALGTTEKVFVTGLDEGLLDARFCGQDGATAGYPVCPLASSATDGLVPATGTTLVSGENVPGLAVVEVDTTISANTTVGALAVKGSATLTVASGVTLTVGDGVKPAGVWLAGASALAGAGTIAFGDAVGYIYRDTPKSPDSLTVPVAITGTKGVHFVARNVGGNGAWLTLKFPADYVVGWSGGVWLNGFKHELSGGKSVFPADFPVHVVGDKNQTEGNGCLLMQANANAYTQNLKVSGAGNGGGALYFHNAGWNSEKWTLAAGSSLTLDGDVLVGTAGNGVFYPQCQIDGEGSLSLRGMANLSATNVYTGATALKDTSTLLVSGAGTLGQGDAHLGSGSLYFSKTTSMPSLVVTNAMPDKTGTLYVQEANVSLEADAAVNSYLLTASATNEIAAALTAKAGQLDYGSMLKGVGEKAVFTFGRDAAETNVIAATLAGSLSFVKAGNNTVELFGPMTYTGATRVEGGVLRLARRDGEPQPQDVSFWIDADDADSLTWADDRVTQWRSKPGYGISFNKVTYNVGYPAGPSVGPVVSERTLAGNRHALYFQRTLTSRLYGSGEVRSREVICVAQAGDDAKNTLGGGGFFGTAGQDLGVRTSTGFSFEARSGSYYQSWKFGYVDGTRVTWTIDFTTAKLLTFGHSFDTIGGFYNSRSKFTPAIGGYNGDGVNGRNWDGDIAEMLSFNRTLADGERQWVENYLGEKWLGKTLHATLAPIPETSLDPATALAVGSSGTFDLNGHDVTVASLAGAGTIVNTSTNRATLRVTGANAFAGTVIGPVDLVAPCAGAVNARFRDGATLVVSGGTASVGSYSAGLPTDGIAFHVDATRRETMTLGENNLVTNWTTLAGSVARFVNKSTVSFWGRNAVPPTYVASGINGKPAAYFTCSDTTTYVGRSSMAANASCTVKTYAIAGRIGKDSGYLMGSNENSELGLIADNGGTDPVLRIRSVTPLHSGETIIVNGVDRTAEEANSTPSIKGASFTAVVTASDWSSVAGRRSGTYYLGGYGNPGADFYLGEAIAWNRVLTPEECRIVADYLQAKWGTSAAFETNVLAATSGIGATGDGALDLGGGDLTVGTLSAGNGGSFVNVGSLTVTDAFVFTAVNGLLSKLTVNGDLTVGSNAVAQFPNAETLDKTARNQTALEVTGEIAGELKGTEGLPKQWILNCAGKVWSIARQGMLLFLR